MESPVYDEKPADFSPKQKQTIGVIVLGLAFMVIFPLLQTLFPNSVLISVISGASEPSLLFVVLLVISLLMKLGDEKKALHFIPWGTIILVCGTGMLVAVAQEAGAIEYLSEWLGNSLSPFAAKALVPVIAGIMSLFSSTLGVVAPTLIPAIPGLADATGVAGTALVSAIMIGGHFAGVSPMSTGGAMTMAGESDEAKKNALFIQLVILAVGSIIFASLLTISGIIS